MAKLVFSLDDGQVITVPVIGSMTVGSAEGNDVLIEDPSIAPHHAELVSAGDGSFALRDLGSAGGTRINGAAIREAGLRFGDEIIFGVLKGHFLSDEAALAAAHAEDEARLRDLHASYSELHSKHQMVLGMVSTLGAQEKQKLASLERLHSDISELESRITAAREVMAAAESSNLRAQSQARETETLRARIASEVSALEKSRTALKEEIADLEKLRAQTEESCRVCNEALRGTAGALAMKEAALVQTSAAVKSATAELAALAEQVRLARAEHDAIRHSAEHPN